MTSKYQSISDKFIFVPSLDEIGNDITLYKSENLLDLMNKAITTPGCVGFNTLGYLKSKIDNLQPSRYFGENDGIYIMRDDVVVEQKLINSRPNQTQTLAFIMENMDSYNTNVSCSTNSINNTDCTTDVKCEDVTDMDEKDVATKLVQGVITKQVKETKEATETMETKAVSNVAITSTKSATKHTIQLIHEKDPLIMNAVFIETGSYAGDGIQAAMDLGFKEIHSIELSDKYYNICKEKFKDNASVTIHKGDSGVLLEPLIKSIMDRLEEGGITFWLDGHFSAPDTACAEKYCSPIQQELEAIRKNTHPDHVILIDDMKDFTPEAIRFNYSRVGKCGYVEKFQLENILSTIHPIRNTYYFGPACVSYSKNKM